MGRTSGLFLVLILLTCKVHADSPEQSTGLGTAPLANQVSSSQPIAGWQRLETSNFVLYACAPAGTLPEFGQRCETLRQELQRKWLGKTASARWLPRCEIIVHPTRDSYLRAAGQSAGQTAAAAYIEFRNHRIAVRRIDLCGEQPECELAALAHELTHVVLAQRFVLRRIPPWADEGMAVLADSVEKQELHYRDLEAALAADTTYDVASLLRLECCPPAPHCATFYGQSLSLVEFLVQRGGPERFVGFLDRAMQVGYDRALEENYAIRGVGGLNLLWPKYASSRTTPPVTEVTYPVPGDGTTLRTAPAAAHGR